MREPVGDLRRGRAPSMVRPMATTPLALLALSFVLGLRHALEVDHLAAVATIAARRGPGRGGMWSASAVGALWGLGHTTALLVVAVGVLAFQVPIPPALASALELGVAFMLIGLGARLLWSMWAGAVVHTHVHAHGAVVHAHPHVHPAEGAYGRVPHADAGAHHRLRVWRRPMLVGLAHGTAGSAALMLLVAATIPSRSLALAYVAAFGIGSLGGMVVMSAIVGLPLALAAERSARIADALRASAALASVGVGLALAWRIAVDHGLFA